jgi:GINS complex subunit 2
MAICGGQNGTVLQINCKTTDKLLGDDKFLALQELVSIVPRFSSDETLECITGEFGPFRAHSVAKVPLWAALELDRLNKCTIESPQWMQEEELKRLRDDEMQSQPLEKVHDHYIEIALALLSQSKTFAADKREKTRISYLLRDIVEKRRNKIQGALKSEISSHPEELNVTGMSAAERTCFRTRSLFIMDHFIGLLAARKVAERMAETQADDSMAQEDTYEDSTTTVF